MGRCLTLYLEEGRLSIDNNPVERALRGVAIGRKKFLFVGNDAGGERAASFYSITWISLSINRETKYGNLVIMCALAAITQTG